MFARHLRGASTVFAGLATAAALTVLPACTPAPTPAAPTGPRTPSAATLPTASPSSSTPKADPCTWLDAAKAAALLGPVGKGIDKATPGTLRNAGGSTDPSCTYTGANPTRELTVSRSTQIDDAMANALITLSMKGTTARLKGVGDRAEHDAAHQRDTDKLTVQTLMVRDGKTVTTLTFASKVGVAASGDHSQQLIAVYKTLPPAGR